jgi:hypothetical protein
LDIGKRDIEKIRYFYQRASCYCWPQGTKHPPTAVGTLFSKEGRERGGGYAAPFLCCYATYATASSAPSARQRAYARWFKMEHFEQNWLAFPTMPPQEYSPYAFVCARLESRQLLPRSAETGRCLSGFTRTNIARIRSSGRHLDPNSAHGGFGKAKDNPAGKFNTL